MIISVLISMFDLSPTSDMPLLFCPRNNLLRSKTPPGTLSFEINSPPTKGDNLLQGRTVYFEVKCPREARYFEVKCPGGDLLRSKVSGGRHTSGGELLRDRPVKSTIFHGFGSHG